MLDTLDASAVRRWSLAAADTLDRHRAELDGINVFPVADGDTGTNLAATLRAAADAVQSDAVQSDAVQSDAGQLLTHPAPSAGATVEVGAQILDTGILDTGILDTARTLRAMARGAVLGARGNSGVIMSQVLRGLADGVDEGIVAARAGTGTGAVDGARFAAALLSAAERAFAAVADPVDGTMLTVVRAAADALPGRVHALPAAVAEAVRAASAALLRTPDQLPVLARAGVVDAGGRGVVLVLDALSSIVRGDPVGQHADVAPAGPGFVGVREAGSDAYGYEVQYLLDAPEDAVATLRADLGPLGDSLAVAGTGADEWSVHIHVADIGAAIEAGVRAGRPRQIRVTRFADAAVAGPTPTRPAPAASPVPPDPAEVGAAHDPVAVLALAAGPGLAALFRAEAAHVLTATGDERTPLTVDEVLAAIRAVGSRRVVVLPDSDLTTSVVAAAAAIARGEGIRAAVVPTSSGVQGLSALAVHDPARRFEDDVIAMAEAAAATRWAEIVVAARDALTSAGPCAAGDVLGLIDGDVVEIGADVVEVAALVVERLLGVGGELLTLVLGQDAPVGAERAVRDRVERRGPLVEVIVYDGGSPEVPVLMGLE